LKNKIAEKKMTANKKKKDDENGAASAKINGTALEESKVGS
jgi:hypothetical protein